MQLPGATTQMRRQRTAAYTALVRLGILGGGRAAWAYGSAWKRIGWPLSGIWLRDASRSQITALLGTSRFDIADLAAESELLLVAVSDRAIPEVLSLVPPTDALLFHASGATAAPENGFSLHPLLALPPVGVQSDLEGALLVFEGAHRRTAKLIASAVGARFAEVTPEQKPLYHAAAVFGSNYVAAMLEIAERIMRDAGVAGAREDLARLATSAILNWTAHEDARRFTGPAARGDTTVLERHLQALEGDAGLAELYTLLARQISGSLIARPE